MTADFTFAVHRYRKQNNVFAYHWEYYVDIQKISLFTCTSSPIFLLTSMLLLC